MNTDLILVNPLEDAEIMAFHGKATKLKEFAETRVIATLEDTKSATNDLSMIAKLKKAMETKRKNYLQPFLEHVKFFNDTYKTLMSPVEQADFITRQKVMAYQREQEIKRKEAEEINRQKEELARKEAAFNGTGEVTIDTTPVIVPPSPPANVRTGAGMLGTMKVRKFEVVNIREVPVEYLRVDEVAIGKLVRAGIPSIPGIRIWTEDTLKVNSK